MAIYYSKGTISHLSEVESGVSRSGKEWQKMTLILEIPGYQGSVTKQVFQVFGKAVDDVLDYAEGDKVEIGWTMYAREWKEKWYNSVDLVNISSADEKTTTQVNPVQKASATAESLNPESHQDDLPF